jgi:hypothetical protein
VKPKKCDACKYLYRHKLINQNKRFQVVTKHGRTKQSYRCGKFDELYFLVRDKCGGPYKEAEREKGN